MQEEKKKLVNQARKGDTHAFAKLYEEIYPDLYRFAFCMVRQPWKAEDVVSDAVLKAFEKIHTLKKPESFRSWIFQITANECRIVFRQEKRVVYLPEVAEAGMRELNNATTEDNVLIKELLMQLEERERMIVGLSIFGGYSGKELAQYFHKKEGTIRSIKSRALGKLKQAWECRNEGKL